MANEQNLKPFTKGSQTHEEAQKRGALGGIASGIARRKKSTMRQIAKLVLELTPVLPPKVLETVKNMGVDTDKEPVTILLMTILAIAQKAIKGDLKAAQVLLEMSGEAVTSFDSTDRERVKLERKKLDNEQKRWESEHNGINADAAAESIAAWNRVTHPTENDIKALFADDTSEQEG